MSHQQDFLHQLDNERTAAIQAQQLVERESLHSTIRATLLNQNDWFCSTDIQDAFGWTPRAIATASQQMYFKGLLERREHYYGARRPGKDYRGFRYEFKVIVQAVEGAY